MKQSRMFKLQEKAETMAVKSVNKVMSPLLKKMTLVQQVKFSRSLLPRVGIIDFRMNLLKESGLPLDILEMYQSGKSKEEIHKYYFECPEFMKFWEELNCNADMLEGIIDRKEIEYNATKKEAKQK